MHGKVSRNHFLLLMEHLDKILSESPLTVDPLGGSMLNLCSRLSFHPTPFSPKYIAPTSLCHISRTLPCRCREHLAPLEAQLEAVKEGMRRHLKEIIERHKRERFAFRASLFRDVNGDGQG